MRWIDTEDELPAMGVVVACLWLDRERKVDPESLSLAVYDEGVWYDDTTGRVVKVPHAWAYLDPYRGEES